MLWKAVGRFIHQVSPSPVIQGPRGPPSEPILFKTMNKSIFTNPLTNLEMEDSVQYLQKGHFL